MNQIDHHISELLFDHDCVIVPSLGGFLASEIPSTINPAQHLVSPPFRKIAFNVYLKQNDGLLARQLSEYEQVNYTDALRLIDEYVTSCYQSLNTGQKITVEKVGTLVYDKERNIQFEAFRNFNHLKEAFGMSSLRLIPIDREPVLKDSAKRGKGVGTIRPAVKSKSRGINIRNTARTKYLGLIAVAGALVWFALNLFLVAPRHINEGSLSPFEKESPVDLNQHLIKPVIKPPVEIRTITPAAIESAYASVAVIEKVATQIQVITPPVSVAPPPTIEISPLAPSRSTFSPGSYYLIAGVFRIPGNAQAYFHSLQEKGFHDIQIIQSGELNYVCINSFGYRHDALAMLDSLKKEEFSTWILHK